MGGVGGPCDFSVSPSPFGLDFGTLDFGTSDLGLTILDCLFSCSLFLGCVDIRGLGGAATCGEGNPGEKLWPEDEAELHQEHLHRHRASKEASPVDEIGVD